MIKCAGASVQIKLTELQKTNEFAIKTEMINEVKEKYHIADADVISICGEKFGIPIRSPLAPKGAEPGVEFDIDVYYKSSEEWKPETSMKSESNIIEMK
jgi:hypothetical protein